MKVYADGLGYREVSRMADFMGRISDKGISGDTAEQFRYDVFLDEAYCITESGKVIWAECVERS